MVALPRWLRRRSEKRADWARQSDRWAWWPDSAMVRQTSAGEPVTEERALGLSAYYASLRNGSQDIAKLPRKVRRWYGWERRGSEVLERHPAALLLRRPNPVQTWGAFCQVMQHRAMGWGNGYAEIVRNAVGDPLALWPLHPGRVTPMLDGKSGTLTYEVLQDGGGKVTLAARDVFHIKGMGDGICGYSVVRFAAEALGLGIAAQRHAGLFFGSGMGKQMVAFVKGPTLDAAARKALRARIVGDAESDPNGVRKLKIIDGLEVDLKDAGINPDEAQFLEQREFGVEEVARWFRMSLAKLQYHKRAQGWGTLDALNTDYAVDFIQPWVATWEEECWSKLLTEAEQYDTFVKFNLNGLMRGDSTARIAYYASGLQNGWLSPNDVRELEDMDPIEQDGADDYRTQMQMVPLEAAESEEPETETAASESMAPMPPIPMEPVEDEESPDDAAEDEAEGEDAPEASVSGPAPVAVVRSAAEAMRGPMEAQAVALVRVAANATARALAKHAGSAKGYADWALSWGARHADEVVLTFAPFGASLEAVAGALGVPGVGGVDGLRRVAADHLASLATPEAARKWGQGSPEESGRSLADAVFGVLIHDVKESPRA